VTVAELKKYIYENNKIEYVLDQIGCGHIVYHPNKEYYSASNYDMHTNKAAININNNEYLNCKNRTREKYFDEKSDLITLVQYNKQYNFFEAIKYLHDLFDLVLTYDKYKQNKSKTEKDDPLYIFKKIKSNKSKVNVLDFNTLDEEMLNDFVPYIHIDWYREGIAPWTVAKYGLAYSYKYKRNIIPLRYWLDGKLLGFNMRTTITNYDLFDIKKYFITPNYPKHINLFGLWENKEAIQKAGYVVVYESEKSCLKRHSLNDGTGVALSGHTISDEQVRILIGLNIEIIIALDKDIDIQEVRHMY
jgi:DNA primase